MKNLSVLLTVAAAVMLCCGCVRTEVESQRLTFGKREKKSYEPIRSHNLRLELSGNGQLFAGEGGNVTFVLINGGNQKIVIDEWYAHEPDNIVISCQNWLPGMTGYDPENWIKLEFAVKKPAWRYPLSLAPGGRMFITKKLPFVDKLRITPGSERRYFLKADSNLTSLKLESKIVPVSVRNIADKRTNRQKRGGSRHFDR